MNQYKTPELQNEWDYACSWVRKDKDFLAYLAFLDKDNNYEKLRDSYVAFANGEFIGANCLKTPLVDLMKERFPDGPRGFYARVGNTGETIDLPSEFAPQAYALEDKVEADTTSSAHNAQGDLTMKQYQTPEVQKLWELMGSWMGKDKDALAYLDFMDRDDNYAKHKRIYVAFANQEFVGASPLKTILQETIKSKYPRRSGSFCAKIEENGELHLISNLVLQGSALESFLESSLEADPNPAAYQTFLSITDPAVYDLGMYCCFVEGKLVGLDSDKEDLLHRMRTLYSGKPRFFREIEHNEIPVDMPMSTLYCDDSGLESYEGITETPGFFAPEEFEEFPGTE